MKTILFLLNRECTFLPPFMTILDVLSKDYYLKVISCETQQQLESIRKRYKNLNVEFLSTPYEHSSRSFSDRVIRRIKTSLNIKSSFHREAVKLLNTTSYDLLWVIHEETAFEFRKELMGNQLLLS